MTGLLIITGLVVAIMVIFVHLFRKRAARTLEQSGHRLPEELAQQVRAPAKKPAPAPVSRPTPVAAPREHFLLIYDVGPDFLEARTQYRDEHLVLVSKASAAGDLVLAGALEPPTEQAFLLFTGSREAAMRFAEADPYVRHGLVRRWRVKQWHTVAGQGILTMTTRADPVGLKDVYR